ncbi:hypothetical protein LCGC14_0297760 [marine sediment metagenome]|uniref:Uncharacterized protein n=1 Tax=marine sediment metagenome TaxID=412755 RepID=A0A0F9U853_9ZZZZ
MNNDDWEVIMADLRRQLSQATKRVEELEAVVDGYPKMADGPVITKGAQVFPSICAEDERGGEVVGFVVLVRDNTPQDTKDVKLLELDEDDVVEACFSTQAAAEQARKEE